MIGDVNQDIIIIIKIDTKFTASLESRSIPDTLRTVSPFPLFFAAAAYCEVTTVFFVSQ